MGTAFDATAEFTGPFLVAIALGGIAVSRGPLRWLGGRLRTATWAVASALSAFTVYAAPIVLTGRPGATGYARIVDIGLQFDLSAALATTGRVQPEVLSSYDEVVHKLLGVGYPGGFQSALGSLARLTGIDIAWVYQPLLAFVASMLALCVYSLLQDVIASRPMRGVAAFGATQANLLYAYGLGGGFKELTASAMLVLAAAALRAHRPDDGTAREVLPLAVALAAGFSVFSLTILPWLGVLLACFVVLTFWRRGRRRSTVAAWLALGAFTLALSLPTAIATTKVGGSVSVVQQQHDLGNLAAPEKPWIAAGVWWTGDHRYPLPAHITRTTLNYVLIGVVLALALAGIAHAAHRRDAPLLALAAAAAIALPVVSSRTGPWVDQKVFALTTPICIALAFVGTAALSRWRIGYVAAWLGALVVAGAVLFGNALVYHDTALMPYDRSADLARIGERFAGKGPTLYPAFDEYAEYFLRKEQAVSLVDPPKSILRVRPEVLKKRPGQQFVFDLDDFEPSYLQSFRLIVERRSPQRSRPPSNYRLVERTRFHEVWQRDPASDRVLAHLPLTGRPGERSARFCENLARRARVADPRARIAYSTPATTAEFDPGMAPRVSSHWQRAGADVVPFGPGRVAGELQISRPGRYMAWLEGSTGRPLRFWLGGHELGRVAYEMSYPGGYVPVGARTLSPGKYSIEIQRGGGDLHPGSGNGTSGYIGPLVLARDSRAAGRAVIVSRATGLRVCRSKRPLDWMEMLEPRV
jgi:hypothetical protein